MTYRLLFVCLGNICRSPSAENIMNHLVQQRGLSQQVQCDSAGTSSYHIGSSPDRRMSAAAQRKLGFPLVGAARQFEATDFEQFDLILAMDQDNYAQMSQLDRQGKYTERLKLMCEFCREHTLRSVPDPYYGGEDGFNFVIDLLVDACNGLLDELIETGAIQG
ncbi:low molecular weight phosphotyrosine protein phosphatase [filamentous cyanobacterium LEGE 11480]|uniref:protein-tyrosine-phosphatase n=1 Tax=Romeriopsis navalis LEGE 11480 TaxID=2777977 RepID=A0A928VR85_9CYAN|nr:low molecular weight protein-tyrosine-phosphatase [Romeriopsis navalis]MBE9031072.1 low molecular weight phosphotyrosine protein phosphatase [Romeriopsis navalis LEGE 11480]